MVAFYGGSSACFKYINLNMFSPFIMFIMLPCVREVAPSTYTYSAIIMSLMVNLRSKNSSKPFDNQSSAVPLVLCCFLRIVLL